MKDVNYSLISQPWIPALTLEGEPRRFGLLDLLAEAHNLQGINVPAPVVKAGLYRLLIALLGRVFGPENRAAWAELWAGGAFDRARLSEYFTCWPDSFYLFHPERPFFQAADRRVKPKKLLKMIPHLASGNNPTLFDHSTEARGVSLSPAEAALYLVALQYFGLGGLSGIEEKFTNAPAGKGINFFVQGDNLFETLMLNLLPPSGSGLNCIFCRDPVRDRPCWEMEDPFEPRSTPYGWFDYLTWQNRRVLLFPESEAGELVVQCMTEAPGLRLADDYINCTTIRDPFHYYRQAKTGPLPLRFSEDRAVWRDSAALLGFQAEAGAQNPPPNLTWLHQLSSEDLLPSGSILQLNALGLASDKAKALFYGDERLPLPVEFIKDPDSVDTLKIALDQAENLERGLRWAISSMAEVIASFEWVRQDKKPDPKQVDALRNHLRADRVFWSGLENDFYSLVERIPHEPEAALKAWQSLLITVAWRAFDYSQALAGEDVRVQKAAVKARGLLAYQVRKIFNGKE